MKFYCVNKNDINNYVFMEEVSLQGFDFRYRIIGKIEVIVFFRNEYINWLYSIE